MKYDSNIQTDIGNMTFDLLFKPTAPALPGKYDPSTQHNHDHAYFEIHIPHDGISTWYIEEEKFDLFKNDILIIFPGTFHYRSNHSDDFSTSTLSVEITKNKKSDVHDFYTEFFQNTEALPGYFLMRNVPSIVEHISKIHDCVCTHMALYDYIATSRLTLFFAELIAKFCHNMDSEEIQMTTFAEHTIRKQTIQIYLALHYAENITLKKIANLLNLSEKHTNRTFTQLFGITFSAYLTQIRLKNAKKLLKDSAHSLEDVARGVGYNSYNGFYIAFKKQFGVTPLEYRKKHMF